MKLEIKKDFSDESREYEMHKDLIEQNEKFHKERLQQEGIFHKEKLEEQKKSNKELVGATKEVEEKRYSQYERWQKISSNLTLVLVFVNLLLVGLNVVVWIDNHRLIQKQLETLTPLKPELQIISDDDIDNRIIHRFSLADMRKTKDNGTWINKERLHFKFQNVGRMDTGSINGRIKNPWVQSEGLHIENVDGESSVREFIDFWYVGCSINSNTCMSSNVPLGNQLLEIEFHCNFCQNETLLKNVNICIWENSTEECDSFRKGYS